MYRAFILDDDPATRDGLKNYFNWAKYDVEIIGDAPDGDVAYSRILELRPDILVSDVKMPRMDGTLLLQKLSAAGLRIAALFISGYSEVSLVKSAIRFGAQDYILKPLDLSELESAVARMVARLREDSAKAERLSRMEAQLRRSMPLLRDRYVVGLLKNGASGFEEIQSDAEFLGLEVAPEEEMNVFVLTLDEYGRYFDPATEREKYLCGFAVQNIITELIGRSYTGYIAQEEKRELVGLIQSRKLDPGELAEFYAGMRRTLAEALGVVASIGVGRVVRSLTELPSSYRVASENAKDRFLRGSGVYAAQNGRQRKKADMLLAYQYLNSLRLDLTACQDPARMDAVVEDIFDRLLAVEDIGEEDIKILPLSTPVLATIGLFYMVSYWNDYFNALIYISKPDLKPLQLYLREMILQSSQMASQMEFTTDDLMNASPDGIRSAAVVAVTLPILVVYPFVQKYFVKGITMGSVKG